MPCPFTAPVVLVSGSKFGYLVHRYRFLPINERKTEKKNVFSSNKKTRNEINK
jgi:hypothetical protein